MNRTITDVRWANDRKTQIFCRFNYDDGRILDAYVTNTKEGNPDWFEIMAKFPRETIQMNTDKFLESLKNVNELNLQNMKEQQENMKNEALFNMKLDLFAIPEIKGSKNTKLKSRIRKAKSLAEANVLASVLVMLEMNNANTTTETE